MRPIDADALLTKAIEGRRFTISYKDVIRNEFVIRTAYQDLADFLNSAPTLTLDDLRPKGRWKDGECTNCGCDALYHKGVPAPTYTDFCHSCGADMRGGGVDG